ncbi:MAG TPA: DNA polymerase III subunit beta [Gammaproteobacteria bacterium]|nr:DNA polymerase III subunit beta [Gammaproteobacteria bacterium]
MRFTISRDSLLRPLQTVSGVVEKRQGMSVLSNILVEMRDQDLWLTGTDLEVELRARAEPANGEGGEVTLPARKFVDLCRTLPEGAELEVKVEEGRALIRSGRTRFTLATIEAAEFPNMDAVAGGFELELEQQELRRLIEQTQFAMAQQDVRYYLNGLLLEVDGKRVRTVATDGHRLAICDLERELAGADERQVIIPRKGVVELGRLVGDSDEPCKLVLNSSFIKVEAGDVTLTSKLIDGRFPDYERVIPQDGGKVIRADRETLRQALVRTAVVSNEKYRGIRLQLEENRLVATVNNPEQEEAVEEVEVEYQGEPFEIGFNVGYLLDALGAIREETVELSLTDANSSCLIKGVEDTSSRYVVMPMRL